MSHYTPPDQEAGRDVAIQGGRGTSAPCPVPGTIRTSLTSIGGRFGLISVGNQQFGGGHPTERLACNLLFSLAMKRASYRVHHGRGGWIRTTLSPINNKREGRFGAIDILMFVALVVLTIGAARFFLAH